MKKALFLSHKPPFPEIGGDRRRIAQSLRLLTELYDVDIAYISNNKNAAPMKDSLPGINGERKFYASQFDRLMRASRTLFNSRSLVENLFLDRALLSYVKEVAGEYDLIFCASPVMATYAMQDGVKHKVLDMTDSLTLNYENAARQAKGWRKHFYHVEARRMRRFESRCREVFESIAYISEIDRDFLGKKVDGLHIVHNSVPDFDLLPAPSGRDRNMITFVGKMDYEPNIVATTFFAREVMPLLHQEHPDARFVIVGANPTPGVRALASLPGVGVTGLVPTISPYYLESAVVVAPMLSGSGVQNKILEALAHGCAVVTTGIGLEGIECLVDVLTVVEPDPQKWAEEISRILKNPDSVTGKRTAAPRRVEEEFGLSRVRKQFQEFLKIKQ